MKKINSGTPRKYHPAREYHPVRKRQLFEFTSASDVLIDLLAAGVLTAMAAAPYLAVMSLPFAYDIRKQRDAKKKLCITFHNLKRRGLIRVESKRGSVRITLTEKGRARALKEKLSLDLSRELYSRRKPWDRRWRILLFDIPTKHNMTRDALRHLLKKVGFAQLQQSVWVYPFDCRKAVENLKSFFELDDNACRLIITDDIGDDHKLRRHFAL